MFHVPEKYRVIADQRFGTDSSYKNNGVFEIGISNPYRRFWCVVSDGEGWEHVSVSVFDGKLEMKQKRCPTWEEMFIIKAIFWDNEDCVIQSHPAKSEYVNCHPFCLHLWRPTNQTIPTPPKEFVGPASHLK